MTRTNNNEEVFFSEFINPAIICRLKNDRIISEKANKSFYTLFKYKKTEFETKDFLENIFFSHKKDYIKITKDLKTEGIIKDYIAILSSKSGEKITGGIIGFKKGKKIYITISDISKRLNLQDKLSELAEVFKNFQNPICLAESDGSNDFVITDINPAFERDTGFSAREVLGNKLFECNIWKDSKLKKGILNELMEKGVIKDRIITLRTKKNKYFKAGIIINTERSRSKKIHKIQFMFSDISSRLKLKEKLTELAEVFRQFQNPICLATLNKKNRYIVSDVNPAFEKVTGFKRTEIINKELYKLRIWKGEKEVEKLQKELAGKTVLKDKVFDLRKKDSKLFKAGVIINKVIDEESGNEKLQFMFSDITDRIKMRKKIERNNIALIEKNRIINNITRGIAHKIGNYVMPIITYVDLWQARLIRDKLSKEDLTKTLKSIKENAIELERFADSSTVLTEEAQAKRVVDPEIIKMRDIVKKSFDMFIPEIRRRHIEIINCIPENIEVYGNKAQVREIFDNLIGNAVKYTKKGRNITVGHENLNNNYYRFYVRDSGDMIDKKYRKLIFNPYFRIKKDLDKRGSGIGLSVCKLLVKIHRGKIGLRAGKNKGNEFYFTLPNPEKGKELWN